MPIFRRWSGPNLLTNSSVPGKIITCTDLGKGRGVRSNLDRLGFVTREISQHKKVSNFRPFITISTVADDWRWNPRNSEGGRERMANWGGHSIISKWSHQKQHLKNCKTFVTAIKVLTLPTYYQFICGKKKKERENCYPREGQLNWLPNVRPTANPINENIYLP